MSIIAAIVILGLSAGISLFITFGLPTITSNFSMSSVADSPEEAVKNYYVALNNKDFELLINCFLPEYADKLKGISSEYETTDKFFEQRIDNGLKNVYGDNVAFVVSDFKTEPQQISQNGKYNGVDVSKMNVDKISMVKYSINVKGTKYETSSYSTAVVYCINDYWYISSMTDSVQ